MMASHSGSKSTYVHLLVEWDEEKESSTLQYWQLIKQINIH